MKKLLLAFLLLPCIALAQQPQRPQQLQQSLDSAEATVTRIVTGLGNQVGAAGNGNLPGYGGQSGPGMLTIAEHYS
jgi:hypothetical protein